MNNKENIYQKADKIHFHDKVLGATIIRLVPAFIKPNHITIFRFLATPVIMLFMIYGEFYLSFWFFLIIAFSDALDGSLARIRGQITDWGKMYDPLADKILIGSMVFMVVLKYIDFWTSIIIIGIEMIFIIAAWIRKRKGLEVQANIWGKIKMLLQVAGVAILLLAVIFNWAALIPFASKVLYMAIAFAIVSLLTHGV